MKKLLGLFFCFMTTLCYAGNVVTTEGQIPGFNVNEIGDISFKLDSGLQYGCIGAHDVSDDLALPAQDTWYQVVSFDTNNRSNGDVVIDHTNDHIIAGKSGDYLINMAVYAHSAQVNEYWVQIRINNGATSLENLTIHITTDVAGKLIGGTINCFAPLTADDTVEMWVKRVDGGAVEKTLSFDHVILNVLMVGS